MTPEEFCSYWSKKADTPEGRLAEVYHRASQGFEGKQMALLRRVRPKKGVPVFSEGSEQFISDFEGADRDLMGVREDIEKFLELAGGEPSLAALLDRLARARRQVSDTDFQYRTALKQAISRGLEPSEAEVDAGVAALHDRRDAARTELTPIISELEQRLADAKALLEKYA